VVVQAALRRSRLAHGRLFRRGARALRLPPRRGLRRVGRELRRLSDALVGASRFPVVIGTPRAGAVVGTGGVGAAAERARRETAAHAPLCLNSVAQPAWLCGTTHVLAVSQTCINLAHVSRARSLLERRLRPVVARPGWRGYRSGCLLYGGNELRNRPARCMGFLAGLMAPKACHREVDGAPDEQPGRRVRRNRATGSRGRFPRV
jgi:hypothetical protein